MSLKTESALKAENECLKRQLRGLQRTAGPRVQFKTYNGESVGILADMIVMHTLTPRVIEYCPAEFFSFEARLVDGTVVEKDVDGVNKNKIEAFFKNCDLAGLK